MNHTRNRINRTLTFILIITIFVTPALATSAGVSPASITLNATQGETVNVKFAVVNTGNDTTNYAISARGNITNWTYFNNTVSIRLDGKKSYPTDADIIIPKDLPDGTYKGDIIIKSVPEPSKSGNPISLKVNLPVTIKVSRPPQNSLIWIVGIISVMILIGLIEMKRREKHVQYKLKNAPDN